MDYLCNMDIDNKLILHIPHSSVEIPNFTGFLVDQKRINSEIDLLTDWFTNDLFESEKDFSIKAGFSRVFCDVERFVDDNLEPMAKVGMGVLYETCDDGTHLRVVTPAEREQILLQYYHPHHKMLLDAVDRQLDRTGSAIIVDCHSFTQTPMKRDQCQLPDRPDFNIGTDIFHTPQKVVDAATEFFKQGGFTLGKDWPYQGTMVPLKYYKKDRRVTSIMLEVNRRLYLVEGKSAKSDRYDHVKTVIDQFLDLIRTLSPTLSFKVIF